MKQDSKPLWQRLNEERTQGEWICDGAHVYTQDQIILLKSGGTYYVDNINMKYSTLAVNHLASLAEALEAYMSMVGNTGHSIGREYASELYDKAKEALNKIS